MPSDFVSATEGNQRTFLKSRLRRKKNLRDQGTPRMLSPKVMGRKTTPRSGFTLIELLIVLSILGMALSIVSRNHSVVLERSRDAALMTEVRHLRNAIHQYALDNAGTFPPDLSSLEKYLGRRMKTWKGGRGEGVIFYDPETGRMALYNKEGAGEELARDSKGRAYGEY